MKSRPIAFAVAATVLIAAAYAGYRYWSANGEQPRYKLAKVESGPLTAAVAATGTLNPVVSVQVGSQVSGQIKEILVDFNSPVKAGQLIARIDPETFQLRVHQAEADLEATRAAVAVQKAEVARSVANLMDAQRDYERKKMLVEKGFISPADRDKAQTTYDAAKAATQVAEAQARNSEAIVRQRQSQLAQARVDLERTAIRSPVDGVVVKRSVDTGQTVAASLQAPELFIIARNLTDMQVEASIDEADVGRIRVGQKTTFTVDAFPGRGFEGAVMQVRKAAKVESNVVSYTVVISASNADLALLPGMTANVRIVSAQKEKALKVMNAALRFRPPGTGDERSTAAPGAPQGGAAPGSAGGAKQMRDRLVKELNLDAAQQEKLDAIYAGMRDRFASVRDLPEADRAKAGERNRAELREQVSLMLTPEQKKRYDEMAVESQAARAGGGGGSGRVWVVGDDARPKAVPVRLGLTDGTMTEVVGGELAEGAEVIVGIASAAGKPAPTSGPRMF
ncbi:MAG: efflux RND transporter periplasmic adaptor subunit [Rhodocyclaceae bacterium]|nr:efflux RND transporter periplasmic adaptor subunit [Rhodocyclaceae bacterium]